MTGSSKSEMDLKAKFEEFKRQRDRDLNESVKTSWKKGVKKAKLYLANE